VALETPSLSINKEQRQNVKELKLFFILLTNVWHENEIHLYLIETTITYFLKGYCVYEFELCLF